MQRLLLIRTAKFPVLAGEEQELINPGTHGKAFALYLQSSLQNLGYTCPFICCEDWGWWVEIKLPGKSIGLGCYRDHDQNTECEFVCSPSPESDRVWSWSHFSFIDIGAELVRLVGDLKSLFDNDPHIEFVGEFDEFPLGSS